jgi:hypothetical protein
MQVLAFFHFSTSILFLLSEMTPKPINVDKTPVRSEMSSATIEVFMVYILPNVQSLQRLVRLSGFNQSSGLLTFFQFLN